MNYLYLITGAAGHLGCVLASMLRQAGAKVRGLVLPTEKNLPPDIDIFVGDVRDKSSMLSFFSDFGDYTPVVIHCAGIVSIATKVDTTVYEVNVKGTDNIIEMCKSHGVEKLIYVSSVHAIPEKPKGQVITETDEFSPDTVIGSYAKTKAQATANVLSAKDELCVCVVHPSGIVGPADNGRGHLTTLIIDYYKRRLTSGIYGGYDFVDVRDVAQGIISASQKGRCGECYILSNKFYSIKDILTLLHEITGKRKITNFLPLWFVKLTAPLAELYYKILRQPPLFTSYSIHTLNSNANFSHAKAAAELGYTTRDMRDTLTDTVNWLKEKNRI